MVEAKHYCSIAKGNLTRKFVKNIVFVLNFLEQTRNLT